MGTFWIAANQGILCNYMIVFHNRELYHA
jgi:hypothetical protein